MLFIIAAHAVNAVNRKTLWLSQYRDRGNFRRGKNEAHGNLSDQEISAEIKRLS
jgi:hypothetical protein